jgi:predicted oxidoreductase
VRERTVAEIVEAAPSEARVPLGDLPFDSPAGALVAVRVIASITHTVGGLRVDDRARVLDAGGAPLERLWAAGVDAGGVATGGYASGLAQALVLGLAAAEDAAAR